MGAAGGFQRKGAGLHRASLGHADRSDPHHDHERRPAGARGVVMHPRLAWRSTCSNGMGETSDHGQAITLRAWTADDARQHAQPRGCGRSRCRAYCATVRRASTLTATRTRRPCRASGLAWCVHRLRHYRRRRPAELARTNRKAEPDGKPEARKVGDTGHGVIGSMSPLLEESSGGLLEESSGGLRCGLLILSMCAFADLDSTD